jgi:hypothetical protein
MRTSLFAIAALACASQKGVPSDTGTTEALKGPLAGIAVAAGPDLSGDGLADVLISAPHTKGNGAVYLLSGATSGALGPGDAAATLMASAKGDLGPTVEVCSDLDGDGSLDVLVGSPDSRSGKGGAWLLRGPWTGEQTTEATDLVPGNALESRTGYAIGCGGDQDGDGLGDATLAGPDTEGFGSAELGGTVYYYRGVSSGTPDLVGSLGTTFSDSRMGYYRSLVAHTDFNGDGLADLAVGASGADKLHLVWGPFDGTDDTNASAVTYDGEPGEGTGHALAAGDLDGDGAPELIAGAPKAAGSSGAVWTFEPSEDEDGGRLVGWAHRYETYAAAGSAGFSVAFAGDLDGDGIGDLLVGAPDDSRAAEGAGAVYVLLGPPTGDLEDAVAVIRGDAEGARLGWSVAASDLNADGLADIVAGAPERNKGRGAAYVLLSPLSGEISAEAASATFQP